MNPAIRSAMRYIYDTLPFKAIAFNALRGYAHFPQSVHQHFHFKGCITIPIDKHIASECIILAIKLRTIYLGGLRPRLGSYFAQVMGALVLASLSGTILDIGANTGVYALSAAALNPRAQVYAFEPVL